MTPEIASHIKGMEKAGRHAAETLIHIAQFIKAGVTTEELDKIVHDYTLSTGAKPATLGYHGFPKSCCTSVNQVVCHGVPDRTLLKNGDIVNVDITSLLNGFFGDTSATFFVGEVSEEAKHLVEIAEKCRDVGIEQVGPGQTVGDIGFEINKLATRNGFAVVRDIGGHGIGTKFHDEPFVPSYGKKGKGYVLRPWMCITVEPMINENDCDLVEHPIAGSSHKWYETADRCLSAQFEHTVLVTDKGFEIMTKV